MATFIIFFVFWIVIGSFRSFLEKLPKIATKKPSLPAFPSAEFSLHPQRALFMNSFY